MSEMSNDAIKLVEDGDLQSALQLAIRAVQDQPDDWHVHYALANCYRWLEDYERACDAYERSIELNQQNRSVFLGLAIVRQLKGDLGGAITALRPAFEIDPDFVLAYNTLGMTQKLMGEYEKASLNYAQGAKALSRLIVSRMQNSFLNPSLPAFHSKHDLWLEYATYGALYLAAKDNIDEFCWPTSSASLEAYGGLYWNDSEVVGNTEGKIARLFLPSFFSAFFVSLTESDLYCNLIGNRNTVLRLLGEEEEAERHLEEAQEFKNLIRRPA